jgi:hypothetical protein
MNAHVVRAIVPGGKMPPTTAGKDEQHGLIGLGPLADAPLRFLPL